MKWIIQVLLSKIFFSSWTWPRAAQNSFAGRVFETPALDLDAMYLDLTRNTSLLHVGLLVIYYYLFFFIPNHNSILCNRHFPDLYLNGEYRFIVVYII